MSDSKLTQRNEGRAVIIAWVNGKWLNRRDREAKIAELQPLIDEIHDENGELTVDIDALPEDMRRELSATAAEYERLRRIHKAEADLLYFAYEYFGEMYNADNSGNWIPVDIDEAPAFHRDICEIMNTVSTRDINAKVAVAAPRSHAKSSFLSKAFPMHELVFRKRKYAIIISETPQVSTANMEWLSLQLKSNEKLRRDFGPLLSPKQQENPKDNSSEFIAWEPRKDGTQRLLCRVEAASTGQALRGRNWNGARPDLIVCDDLEGKKNTNTDLLRSEMKDWFTQVVVPLGDPAGKKTALVYMGTMVHHDSLLRYVMESRSDFRTQLYRAIIEWPERMDLWEACRLVYIDRDNPNRAPDAEALYRLNRAEMERGAIVLWPDVQPLWKLMTWKWDNGSKAFNTEYMNNPVDEENMVFNPEKFTYWDGTAVDYLSDDYDVYMGVDFAMGKTRGDYSALITIAKHKKSGAIYVIDAYGERVHPDVFLMDIVEHVKRFQPACIAAEAQAAQEFFVHKLREALRHAGYPALQRVKEIYQRSRKELRIEALAPDIENGTIKFTRKHALLLEQFELYGTNTHDDLPDALEMAISVSKNGRKRIIDKPAWL